MKSKKAGAELILELVLATIMFFIVVLLLFMFDTGALELKVKASVSTPDTAYQCETALANLMKTNIDYNGAQIPYWLAFQKSVETYVPAPPDEIETSEEEQDGTKQTEEIDNVITCKDDYFSIICNKADLILQGVFGSGKIEIKDSIKSKPTPLEGYKLSVFSPNNPAPLFATESSDFSKNVIENNLVDMFYCKTYLPDSSINLDNCQFKSEVVNVNNKNTLESDISVPGAGESGIVPAQAIIVNNPIIVKTGEESAQDGTIAGESTIIVTVDGYYSSIIRLPPKTNYFEIGKNEIKDTPDLDSGSVTVQIKNKEGKWLNYFIKVKETSENPSKTEISLVKDFSLKECANEIELVLPTAKREKAGLKL